MSTSGPEPGDHRRTPPGQPLGGPPPGGPPAGGWYGGQPPYAHQPHGGPPPLGGPSPWGPSQDERNWAMAAHAGSFLAAWFALGVLAPLFVLLAKGNDSPYVRRHAVESLNFQISALIYVALCFLLVFVLIGIPLLAAYGVFYVVCVVLGAVRASSGEDFRYPATLRFVS